MVKVKATGSAAWKTWREEALKRFSLETIYGDILTGRKQGEGWLEARDPRSKTGDRDPSCGVSDGTGECERGRFKSFRDDCNWSVFDYLMNTGKADDSHTAYRIIADASSVPLPKTKAESNGNANSSPTKNTSTNNGKDHANGNGEEDEREAEQAKAGEVLGSLLDKIKVNIEQAIEDSLQPEALYCLGLLNLEDSGRVELFYRELRKAGAKSRDVDGLRRAINHGRKKIKQQRIEESQKPFKAFRDRSAL